MNRMTQKKKLALAEELAAKVRGYFTNRYGEVADLDSIPAKMDGDRDLYETASRITEKVIQPGKAHKPYNPAEIESARSRP